MANPKTPRSKLRNPPHLNDLDAVLAAAQDILSDGVLNRHAPAHTPTIATSGPDGRPRLRTIVLRNFERQSMRLRFHTDRRSGKINELQYNPYVALHIYDRDQKVQLQISGRAALHVSDDMAEAAWAQSQPMSRICYQTLQAPGSLIEDPNLAVQDPSRGTDGSENFMVVVLRTEALEWLFLDARGHRRARFTRDGKGWPGKWLVP